MIVVTEIFLTCRQRPRYGRQICRGALSDWRAVGRGLTRPSGRVALAEHLDLRSGRRVAKIRPACFQSGCVTVKL